MDHARTVAGAHSALSPPGCFPSAAQPQTHSIVMASAMLTKSFVGQSLRAAVPTAGQVRAALPRCIAAPRRRRTCLIRLHVCIRIRLWLTCSALRRGSLVTQNAICDPAVMLRAAGLASPLARPDRLMPFPCCSNSVAVCCCCAIRCARHLFARTLAAGQPTSAQAPLHLVACAGPIRHGVRLRYAPLRSDLHRRPEDMPPTGSAAAALLEAHPLRKSPRVPRTLQHLDLIRCNWLWHMTSAARVGSVARHHSDTRHRHVTLCTARPDFARRHHLCQCATPLLIESLCNTSNCSSMQGNKQVTRAAIEFYGPDRAKWLGAPSLSTACMLSRAFDVCRRSRACLSAASHTL